MPVSARTTNSHPPDDSAHFLRAYRHHGVDLTVRGAQANGDCPFCGRDGKFTVEVATGLHRCFVCGQAGNPLLFLRALWEHSFAASASLWPEVALDRKLLSPATAASWGVARSCVDGSWLVPGYSAGGKLDQLYKRTRVTERGAWVWRLLPTPGVWADGRAHALHLPGRAFDPAKPRVDICEGPWDGMALFEVGGSGADSNVVAVPGCNVWRDEWEALCRGKHVTLWFDSDHPRPVPGGKMSRAGFDGTYRIVQKLSGVAASVWWLRWGVNGYAPDKPSGWDVRDHVTQAASDSGRVLLLQELLGMVEEAPADWFTRAPSMNGRSHATSIEAQQCHTWEACQAAWNTAMRWRRDMGDALAVLLAVCASTKQAGNQLFLDLVGSAGSGKTTMCEGLLVSRHCHHLEHLTGFHSGWKKKDEDGESKKDCSLIARVNGKTMITPEFDVLRSSPRYQELMAQTRRIFDGKSGATYKNSDEDTLYVGLRTPWVRAGTHAIMDTDQSQLGDRFLRFIIDDPAEDERRAILRSALKSERVAMLGSANCTAGSIVDPLTRKAHALTGGYVDYLRANVEELLARVEVGNTAEDVCIDLAQLSADLRARPQKFNKLRDSEPYDGKELPTRLARQNVRLASCLAVVLNKRAVDGEVMRIVRKVALDTAHGHSLNIARWLCGANPRHPGRNYQMSGGLVADTLVGWCNMPADRMLNYLLFLKNIDVLRFENAPGTGTSWFLTDRVYKLFLRVIGEE